LLPVLFFDSDPDRHSDEMMPICMVPVLPVDRHWYKEIFYDDLRTKYPVQNCTLVFVSFTVEHSYFRFACRILCSREGPDYSAKIFAAGFDSSRNIFLGEKATKWETEHQVRG
jgi:Pellino